jgi:dTDP-4-dehydrorhamnose reductase
VKVLVLGAGGLLGSAMVAALGEHEVATAGREALDIKDPAASPDWCANTRPRS